MNVLNDKAFIIWSKEIQETNIIERLELLFVSVLQLLSFI